MIHRRLLPVLLLLTLAAAPSRAADKAPPLAGPIFNQDSTQFFFDHSAAEMSGELVDAYIDRLARDGVRAYFSCTNAMRANFASSVWEPDWQSYDPKGPDDQPVLRYLPPASVAPTRRRLESTKRLADLGVNFHQRALARCRQRGISPWVSVRMNDVHDCFLTDGSLLSTFFKDQRAARQLRAPYRDLYWPDRALDWERIDVQQHYFRFVQEQLETLDLDGIELDWMRFVYHFRPGHELAGGRAVTAWIRRVRAECARAATRLGHPVRIAVRVPSRPEVARRCGLDAVAWAREGLVDLVVATPFWATTDFDLPMLEWRRLLGGTGVQLAGGLEIRYQPSPNGWFRMMTPELSAGAAMMVLHGGADLVYLFNYFPEPIVKVNKWTDAQFTEFVTAAQSADRLARLARTHAVTFRDVRAPGEAPEFALPHASAGRRDMPWPPGCAFRIPTGPQPVGRAVELTLEFDPATASPERLEVYLNGQRLPPAAGPAAAVLVYAVPGELMQDEAQVVEVVNRDNAAFTIVRVEIAIAAAR